MRCGIIQFSELGDRWDAGFHLIRKEYEGRAAALAKTITEEDAVALLSDELTFSTADLRAIEPLTRHQYRPSARAALLSAVEEYPHLALAIMLEKADRSIKEKQAELDRQTAALAAASARIAGLQAKVPAASAQELPTAPPASQAQHLQDVDPLPEDIQQMLTTHRYVHGVVHVDGDELIIPVHTSETNWLADCWVIEKDDWRGVATLQAMINEGEVPVPRRYSDLGTPIGYLTKLPDHSGNYGVGWRG